MRHLLETIVLVAIVAAVGMPIVATIVLLLIVLLLATSAGVSVVIITLTPYLVADRIRGWFAGKPAELLTIGRIAKRIEVPVTSRRSGRKK